VTPAGSICLGAIAVTLALAVRIAVRAVLRALTARKARRVLAALPKPSAPPQGPVSTHPALYRAVMHGPVPRDGERLSAREAVALAALLYSHRNETAPEPRYEEGQR
jgi:hypothetical protein